MANTILIKRKTTTGAPALGDLSVGEGCLVVPDDTLYYKKDASNLISFSTGGGGGSRTATEIFSATASGTGNNIHGAKGTLKNIAWDASINDSNEITSFSNGGTEVQITNAGELVLDFSVGAIDNGANNRTTYLLELRHLNSSDVEQYLYYIDDTYVRDDNNTYDSGIMGGSKTLFVSAGDKIIIRTRVLDVQTTTGTVNASSTYSKLRILKIT